MKISPNPSIIGHEAVLSYLENALNHDKIGQAVLFIGPTRIGKKKLVNWLIKHQSCLGDVKPCNQCQGCASTTTNTNPDLFWISDEQKAISIQEIRALRSHMQKSPLSGKWVWGIIPDAQRMTGEAANALLKELEEPKQTTRFLLTSSHPDQLLPTIRSRCAPIYCQLVPETEILHALETVGVSREKAQAAARLAQGRPGIAVRFLKDPDFQRDIRRIGTAFLELLPTITPARASIFAASLPKECPTATLVETLRLTLSESLYVRLDELSRVSGIFSKTALSKSANSASPSTWANRLKNLAQLESDLSGPSKPQYIFERFFINL
jgi:DNA polymerase-3 subunit delta'